MHTGVRHLGEELPPFEIAFFRFFLALPLMLPWIMTAPAGTFRLDQIRLHVVRAALNAAAMMSFFMALTMAPLSQAIALNFTAPLFATVLAVVLLRERIGPRRVAGLVVGFLGMLVILRPDVGVSAGSALVLTASLFWAGAVNTIKVLGRTQSSLATTVYASIFIPMFCAPAAFLVWRTPSLEQFLLMTLIAGLGNVGHMCLTQAFRQADVGLLMPFDFTKLVWASLFGFLFFSEVPDTLTLVGGALIMAGVSYVAYRESQLGRTVQPDEVPRS